MKLINNDKNVKSNVPVVFGPSSNVSCWLSLSFFFERPWTAIRFSLELGDFFMTVGSAGETAWAFCSFCVNFGKSLATLTRIVTPHEATGHDFVFARNIELLHDCLDRGPQMQCLLHGSFRASIGCFFPQNAHFLKSTGLKSSSFFSILEGILQIDFSGVTPATTCCSSLCALSETELPDFLKVLTSLSVSSSSCVTAFPIFTTTDLESQL